MGTFLVLDIPKVPSDSTIWELRKSVFGIFGIKNLSRLDSRDMCWGNHETSLPQLSYSLHHFLSTVYICGQKRVLKNGSFDTLPSWL